MEVVQNNSSAENFPADYQLVCRARENGDERAFAALMHMYREPIYLMLLKMTNNPSEADDLTIEAFSKAFNSLDRYVPSNSFCTWLFSIAANHCIDHIRKKRMQTVSLDEITTVNPEGEQSYTVQLPSDIGNPEEAFITEQRRQILREIVSQLKPRYRRMVELRFFEELSYEEIAERLDMPLGTVKAQLFRTRDLLVNILKNRKDLI